MIPYDSRSLQSCAPATLWRGTSLCAARTPPSPEQGCLVFALESHVVAVVRADRRASVPHIIRAEALPLRALRRPVPRSPERQWGWLPLELLQRGYGPGDRSFIADTSTVSGGTFEVCNSPDQASRPPVMLRTLVKPYAMK